MRELKDILVEAKASVGVSNEQVIMLEALIRSRLKEHNVSLENVSTVSSNPVSIIDE